LCVGGCVGGWQSESWWWCVGIDLFTNRPRTQKACMHFYLSAAPAAPRPDGAAYLAVFLGKVVGDAQSTREKKKKRKHGVGVVRGPRDRRRLLFGTLAVARKVL